VLVIEEPKDTVQISRLRFSTSGHVHNKNRMAIDGPVGRLYHYVKPAEGLAALIGHSVPQLETNILRHA
jgi:hypothetical protein